MNRISLLLLLLIFSLPLIKARTIQGYVVSASNSTAVVGASCRLMSDGKLIAGTNVNTEGEFLLETDLKTPLELGISMTGYSSTKILIESGSKNLNLGLIFLDEGTMLNEVTVTGNSVVHSKGRTIIYPSGADVKSSETSISLFQKLLFQGFEQIPSIEIFRLTEEHLLY